MPFKYLLYMAELKGDILSLLKAISNRKQFAEEFFLW